jgi:hypothetical protein
MIRGLFFFTLVSIGTYAQAESYLTGYKIAGSSIKTIYLANGNWYKITNGGSKNYFIPSKTAAEANAFIAHTPSDLAVSLTLPKSCSDIKNYQLNNTDGNQTIDVDGPGGVAPITAYCDMNTDGGGWTLVFNQNSASSIFFANAAEVLQKNDTDPSQNLYSILYLLENFRNTGSFTLKINWPGHAVRNIWSQTTNPTVDQAAGGYAAISVQSTSNFWAGLEHNTAVGVTSYIDGSVGSTNWYYAIGSYGAWVSGNGIPASDDAAGSGTPVTQVQLWVK